MEKCQFIKVCLKHKLGVISLGEDPYLIMCTSHTPLHSSVLWATQTNSFTESVIVLKNVDANFMSAIQTCLPNHESKIKACPQL